MEKGGLGRGASVSNWHRVGETPANMLVELAKRGDSDGVRRESDAGKSIHVKDDEGRTPLIRASMKGHVDTVEEYSVSFTRRATCKVTLAFVTRSTRRT